MQKNEIFTQQADIDAINKPEDKYRSKMFYSIHSTKQALRWMNDAQVEFAVEIYTQIEKLVDSQNATNMITNMRNGISWNTSMEKISIDTE